ncbi:MAG TPA: hypothetical protein VES88_07890 [Gemmatimonadaceae bacterium]|nr:hypothetical protein [Gemmatimonadaceae bacterium]
MVPLKSAGAVLTTCALLIAACTASDAVAPVSRDVSPALARGGGGGGGSAPGYTVIDIGTLPGHSTASAQAVNDAGMVVGTSSGSSEVVAFVWHNNVMTPLTAAGIPSVANDISNGSSIYAVGWKSVDGNSRGMRWRLEGSPLTVVEELDVESAAGHPQGMNDLGDVIGSRIRLNDGTVISPDLPEGFTFRSGVDINNAGHSAFNLKGPARQARAYLRLASGQMVMLEPPANMSADTSVVGAISEAVVDGSGRTVVYVAGKIQHTSSECTPVRWTVDVGGGSVIATETYSVSGSAWGANSLGQLTGTYGARWSVSAFVWSGNQFTTLPMPKGVKNGKGYGMSPGGRYIAGQGEKQLKNRALLWTTVQN